MITKTTLTVYRRDFLRGAIGKWILIPRVDNETSIQYGEGATWSLLSDESGYLLTDKENNQQFLIII